MTARFDYLDKDWLDRAVSWLSARGVQSYALLEGDEVAEFQQRFSSQQTVQRLADHPVFSVQGAALLQLFALSGDKPASTLRPVIDWNLRHCTPPAAPPKITLQ